MAKRKKIEIITDVPTPAAVPTPDLSGIGDALSGDDSRSVNPTPDPTPDPTPAPEPTPDPTPAAPLPCEIIPISMLPAPAPIVLPTFSTPAAPIVDEFNAALDETLSRVGTTEYVALGRLVRGVIVAEFNAAPAGTWTDARYDNVISNLRDQYVMTRPNVNPVYVRPGDFARCADFIDGCIVLGIVDPSRLAYGLIVNHLSGATRTVVKGQGTSVAREGWADWTRKIVPMYLDGTISRESVIASIEAQKLALHTSDPKKFAKPPVKKTAVPSKPAPAAVPTPASKLGMAIPTPASKPAPAAPSHAAPAVPTPAPNNTVVPTPASKPAPAAVPTPAPFNAETLVKSLNPTDFAALAAALAKVGSDDQIIVAYKAIAPRVKMIADRAAAAQKQA